MEQQEINVLEEHIKKENAREVKKIDLPVKVDLTYIITEALKILITEHFWGSVIVLSLAGIVYLVYSYGINLSSFFKLTEAGGAAGLTSGTTILLLAILVIVLVIIIFNSNKIMMLIHDHEFNQSLNKMMMEECRQIKTEVGSLTKILTTLQLMHEDLGKSLKSLMDLISTESINTKKIREELLSINNVIRKIPNRDAILNMLIIRTRLIYNDVSEAILDYVSTIRMARGNNEFVIGNTINKSKLAFVEDRFNHTMEEIKTLYISDVYSYSKNTLSPDVKELLDEALEETFTKIKNSTTKVEDSLSTDELFYIVREDINSLTISISGIFDKGLMLTSFFDNEE